MILRHIPSPRFLWLAAAGSLLFLIGIATMLVHSCGTPKRSPWPPGWSFRTLSPVVSTLTIQNAVVYALSTDATLYALSLPTGEVMWQRPLAMPSIAAPIVKYGLVFVGSNEPAFHAFDALTGTPVWKIPASAPISQPAAFAKGKVFFADDSGLVRAVDALSGKVLWRFQGETPMSAPCIAGEGVCVTTSEHLYCLEQSTGRLRWSLRSGGPSLCSPGSDAGVVFIGGEGGQVLALRASDGSQVWSAPIGEDVEMPPWLQDDKVFVAAGVRLVCLDKTDGRILWQRNLKGRITTPPGGQGSQVFLATERGTFYALDTRKGRPLWTCKVGDTVSGRINFDSGSLFFGTWGGQIRALPLPAGLQG